MMLENDTLYVKFKVKDTGLDEYFRVSSYTKSGKTLIAMYKSVEGGLSFPWSISHHYKNCNIKKFKRKCRYGSYWKQVNPEDFL